MNMATSDNSNIQKDVLTATIRSHLKTDGVKLWMPPYTEDKGEAFKQLASSYADSMKTPEEAVLAILKELSQHAVEKLKQKKTFAEKHIATLKVKLIGSNAPKDKDKKTFTVEVLYTSYGSELKQLISERSGVPVTCQKVICAGSALLDDCRLSHHPGLQNICQILVVCTDVEASAAKESAHSAVASTLEAAQRLVNTDEIDLSDHHHISITNQNGKRMDLPEEERKALLLAMTLHEKGRAALKREDYSNALLLLTEADTQFIKCQSEVLRSVDNYALLCLDIVWCYYCLQNIENMTDAERRLAECESCFNKSYGPNLERLTALNSGTGQERVLLMRLHLLQGILAIHRGKIAQAKDKLLKVKDELETLQIKESDLEQVISFGFTDREARLSLRATGGVLTSAIEHAAHRKSEKEKAEEIERVEADTRKRQRKLGRTADGSRVDVRVIDQLVGMGYMEKIAGEAVKQANNDINVALQMLQDNPELLTMATMEQAEEEFQVTDDMVAQISAMGFDIETIRLALKYFKNMNKAVQELVERGGVVDEKWLEQAANKQKKQQKKSDTSFDDLVSDIAKNADDLLDTDLEKEAEVLKKYLDMLKNLS